MQSKGSEINQRRLCAVLHRAHHVHRAQCVRHAHGDLGHHVHGVLQLCAPRVGPCLGGLLSRQHSVRAAGRRCGRQSCPRCGCPRGLHVLLDLHGEARVQGDRTNCVHRARRGQRDPRGLGGCLFRRCPSGHRRGCLGVLHHVDRLRGGRALRLQHLLGARHVDLRRDHHVGLHRDHLHGCRHGRLHGRSRGARHRDDPRGLCLLWRSLIRPWALQWHPSPDFSANRRNHRHRFQGRAWLAWRAQKRLAWQAAWRQGPVAWPQQPGQGHRATHL